MEEAYQDPIAGSSTEKPGSKIFETLGLCHLIRIKYQTLVRQLQDGPSKHAVRS